ncbi:MAG: hypothetical protein ABI847_08280 [Anaerolineales bacterium]
MNAPVVPPSSSGNKMVRNIGLVVLGLVVVCGVCGSCLFMLQLLLPLFSGGGS